MASQPDLPPLCDKPALRPKDEGVEPSPGCTHPTMKKPVEAKVSSESQAYPAATADATPGEHTTPKKFSEIYSEPPSNWRSFKLPTFLLKNLERFGISRPAAVQAELLRTLRNKRFDVLVASESPSDKRLGVCLSVLCFAHDQYQKRIEKRFKATTRGPAVIVLCPTREHSIQTFAVLKALTHSSPLKTTWAYGGHSVEPQILQLRKGCDVLVATPGRMIKIAGRHPVAQVGLVVVNEAQILLGDSFRGQMEAFWTKYVVDDNTIWAFTCNHHTPQLKTKIAEYLRDDTTLITKRPSPTHNVPLSISCAESIVPHGPRKFRPFEIIQHIIATLATPRSRALILANSILEVETLYTKLRSTAGLVVLLGTYTQAEREMFLRDAARTATRAILTTHAFAAGLEFDDVRYVVQTYLPRSVAPLERDPEGGVESGGRAAARFGRCAWTLLYRQQSASGVLPAWPVVECSKVLTVLPKRRWEGR